MKKAIKAVLIMGCLSGLLNASNFDIGISGSDRGINGFSLSVGDYYRVPAEQIIQIERSIPYEETSVVYFLARHANRSPNHIMDMRLRGLSWWDISLRLGLNPRTLYVVNSRRHSGPPYGQAYGHHKAGKNFRLRDDEITELVNVRFLSSYHGISVDEVIDRRSRGQHYMYIDDDYRMKKYNKSRMQQHDMHRNKERREKRYEKRESKHNRHNN
jgi:hypothetical protein